MKKVVFLLWHSNATRIKSLSKNMQEIADFKVFSVREVEESDSKLEALYESFKEADLVVINALQNEIIEKEIAPFAFSLTAKKAFVGSNAAMYIKNEESLNLSAKLNEYLSYGGQKNLINFLKYSAFAAGDKDIEWEEAIALPWEGIFHPDFLDKYDWDKESYFKKIPKSNKGVIGLITSHSSRVNEEIEIEKMIIKKIEEAGYSVLPLYSYSWPELTLSAKGEAVTMEEYFFDDGQVIINGLIRMTSFFTRGKNNNQESNVLSKLNVPVIKPIASFNMTIDEWEEDKDGSLADVAWSIALPEMEGNIEPIFIGARSKDVNDEGRYPIESRVQKLVDRMIKWVDLSKKPNKDKKCVFILNNNPCASVEATVGGGAKLDSLESVARVLEKMESLGYQISNRPETGKVLVDRVMERKAISDFRWTTVKEIVNKGGCIYQMSKEEYLPLFNELPDDAKESMIKNWGNGIGEEIDGVPAAMVFENKICITGLDLGNALVCVQPKRGCAGARCDGSVCKILHDPHCPPTHQYYATYKYFEKIFRADFLIHVGTHGNLEFLPGRGNALSDACFPDACVSTMPNLYIYNADNPPEGTIAKRRALATIVNHMQTVYVQSGLYENLEDIDDIIAEYELAKLTDPAQAHNIKHRIVDAINNSNLKNQVKEEISIDNVEALIKEIHGILTIIRNTQVQEGMHIFGDIPQGKKKIDMLYGILRYEGGQEKGLRKRVCDLYGLNLTKLMKRPELFYSEYKKSAGQIIEDLEEIGRNLIAKLISNEPIDNSIDPSNSYKIICDRKVIEEFEEYKERVIDLNHRIESSKEMDSLISAADSQYINPGPSGVVTRGKDDVLPTGRNMYTLDPSTVPTKSAWIVGTRLADEVIDKFQDEEGRYPESFGMYWMCNDILWAFGEGMGQLLYFLGVRPKWQKNGKVNDFEIISLEELKRPRIDLSIKLSGILRDNFKDRIDILDRAIRAVSDLDEEIKDNYVRKHTLENIAAGMDSEEAKSRIFGARPGTYLNGTSLQVYASAWKERSDMVDVFTFFNGYSYGEKNYGKESYKALQNSLKSVDITYNKVISDEHDLLGCCCYYGVQGGMTAAARELSGKEVKAYWGDSREVEDVSVRSISEEIDRVVQAKIFNPKWIEGMKKHGYKGASDISKAIGRIYGWEATTDAVGDWVFDEITKTYIENEENHEFFKENNPWALEEIERRLLEAYKRNLWQPEEGLIDAIENSYLEMEGFLEENMDVGADNFQGGAVDIKGIEELNSMHKDLDKMRKALK